MSPVGLARPKKLTCTRQLLQPLAGRFGATGKLTCKAELLFHGIAKLQPGRHVRREETLISTGASFERLLPGPSKSHATCAAA